jgi:four helix bundle protein
MQDYHRLKVWQKAHVLSIDVHRATRAFPRSEGAVAADQLRRAANSVPSNIAEGAAKPGDREFRRFLYMAHGSAAETSYQLQSAHELGFLSPASYQDLSARMMEVRRMLGGLIKAVSSTVKPPRPQKRH